MANVQGDQAPARTTVNVEKIREFVHEGRSRTIHELADTVGISCRFCQEILSGNLNMRRITAMFVPRQSTNDQKQRHVNVCLELQEKANEDLTFTSRIITGDEIWIYGYDPQTKLRSSQ
jgi:histone-lysine N-methyltransferase SETMAR